MRTFESSIVTDFFKEQSWRCRAAIATLRNRTSDDWVDLWLLDCFVEDVLEKDASLLTNLRVPFIYAWTPQGDKISSPTDIKIALEDFCIDWESKQKHSEKKFGWIDTFLMSIIMQVITKYLIQWLLDNFTIQDSNKTKDADCHITPQSQEIKKQIAHAKAVVSTWPVWKQNILVDSTVSSRQTARTPVIKTSAQVVSKLTWKGKDKWSTSGDDGVVDV